MNDGDDSAARFFSQEESAFFKGPHGIGFGSGSLREKHDGATLLHLGFGLGEELGAGAKRFTINPDGIGQCKGHSYKWKFEIFRF